MYTGQHSSTIGLGQTTRYRQIYIVDFGHVDQRKWFFIGQVLPYNAANKQQLFRTAADVDDQITT